MQAVSAEAPFRSEQYLFEVKWDGLRCVVFVEADGGLRLQDRALGDVTGLLPEMAGIGRQVTGPAILDGELVATDEEGRPDHPALRRRLAGGAGASGTAAVGFLAFDLLYHQGRSLLRQPLHRRRDRLRKAVTPGGRIFVPDHVQTEGVELFDACLDRGLEGVMAKHRDSIYVPGQRSPFWFKVRAVKSDDFVVIGWVPAGEGRRFGALLVAYYEDGRLLPCGTVGGGYDEPVTAQIEAELERLEVADSPLSPTPILTAPVRWCRPELVISVRYSEWAPDGTLRFPIFSSLRPEVHPAECVHHRPRVVPAGRAATSRALPDLTRFPF